MFVKESGNEGRPTSKNRQAFSLEMGTLNVCVPVFSTISGNRTIGCWPDEFDLLMRDLLVIEHGGR